VFGLRLPWYPNLRKLSGFEAEEAPVGADDKASNKIDELGGKAKEGLGKLTGDKSTENEGKLDQAKSNVKDAAEKVKDVFK
jgi:uncharacterized protein YjbJ (UPF0337 family)